MNQPGIAKELRLLCSILENIVNDPDNDKYRNLNFRQISKKLNQAHIKWLYNAGFKISRNNKRLMLDSSNIDKAKEVYESLQLIINPTFQTNQQKTNHEKKHHENDIYHCKLDECLSLKIIGRVLRQYQLYLENITSDACKKYDTVQQIYQTIGNNYDDVDLLDDYNHLLFHHTTEFQDICNILHAVVQDGSTCNLDSCLSFIRNDRDRQDDTSNDLYFKKDHISQQLIDRIHCHFFHSYKISQQNILPPKEIKNDDDDSPIKHSKFSTMSTMRKYDYGCRFYYWPHYQYEVTHIDHAGTHRYDPNKMQLSHWYVKNKYDNLQVELLNNEICTISKLQWLQLIEKANKHLKTDLFKQMFCVRRDSAKCYGMKYGDSIHQNHLISLMIYCNNDQLQFKFTETFRKLNQEESDQDLNTRHCNYHFLGKYLREVVECFGMNIPKRGAITTYHGVNTNFTFQSLDAFIAGPFSVTTEQHVAKTFADNAGMILELHLDAVVFRMCMADIEGDDAFNKMCCFDCQYISDFNECEILCIGGLKKLFINNIIDVRTGINYELYIKGIHLISRYISSGGVTSILQPSNGRELKMMIILLGHQLFVKIPKHPLAKEFKNCPKYIQMLLNQHCESIGNLFVTAEPSVHPWRSGLEKNQFDALDKVFKNESDWLDWDTITNLFPNVENVIYIIGKNVLFLDQKPSLFELILSLIKNNTKLEFIQIGFSSNVNFPARFWTEMKEYQPKFFKEWWVCYAQNGRQTMNAYHINEQICNKIWLPKDTKGLLASVFLYFGKTMKPNMKNCSDLIQSMMVKR